MHKLIHRFKFIADAPDGGNIAAAFAQVAAQHLYVGVHGAVLAKIAVVPHLPQQLRSPTRPGTI